MLEQRQRQGILRLMLDSSKIPWVAIHLCDAKRKEFGVRKPGFKSQLCCSSAAWLCKSHWIALEPRFLIAEHNSPFWLKISNTGALRRNNEVGWDGLCSSKALPGCLKIPPLSSRQLSNMVAPDGTMDKELGLESGIPDFKSSLRRLLAMWAWTNH